MSEIYLPTLHAFENGNRFSGSAGLLRFVLTPVDGIIRGELWHGKLCYEKSVMEKTSEFEMSAEGIASIRVWLEENREGS